MAIANPYMHLRFWNLVVKKTGILYNLPFNYECKMMSLSFSVDTKVYLLIYIYWQYSRECQESARI